MTWRTALRWLAVDLAVAIGLAVVSAEEIRDVDDEWWLFTVVMVAGLLLCRHRPLAAVVLTTAGALGHHLPELSELDVLDLAVPIALFALAAAERPRRIAAITCGVLLAGAATLSVLRPFSVDDASSYAARSVVIMRADGTRIVVDEQVRPNVAQALWQSSGLLLALALPYLLGVNLRTRRLHLRTLERRAADLEREQQQRVALATAAERARITRELHDVVAHGLSVMVVQAQGAAAALRRHPDRTETALEDIVTTGRSSLAEMRRLLAIVRDEPGLAPQPGVDALPELIDRIRATGTAVTLAVEGDPVPLPAGVDLSAYRIAQEALTNTLKHAGDGASADVRLGFRPEALEIEVTDDGPAGKPASGEPGSGLRGIAERVRLLGGELEAGPGPVHGFRVRATLPLRPRAAGS